MQKKVNWRVDLLTKVFGIFGVSSFITLKCPPERIKPFRLSLRIFILFTLLSVIEIADDDENNNLSIFRHKWMADC